MEMVASWEELARETGAERIIPLKSPWGWPWFKTLPSERRQGEYHKEQIGRTEMWILDLPHGWEIQVTWNSRFKSWDVTLQAPGGKWKGVAVKGTLEAALEVGRFIY